MFGQNYFTILNADIGEWCKKYNLTFSSCDCSYCGEKIETTVAAFSKNWRGLVAPQCACGEITNFKKFVLTDNTEDDSLISVLV